MAQARVCGTYFCETPHAYVREPSTSWGHFIRIISRLISESTLLTKFPSAVRGIFLPHCNLGRVLSLWICSVEPV